MTTEIELTHDESYWTRVAGKVLDSYNLDNRGNEEARDLGRRIRQAVTDIGQEDVKQAQESEQKHGVSTNLRRGVFLARHGFYYH